MSPRLRIDLPPFRCAVIRSQTSSALGLHQQAHHALDFGRGERRLVARLEALAEILGEFGGHAHAGGVVERIVERPDRHVGDAHVVDAVRPLPADHVGEVVDGARPQRLVPGVARLAADHRVLQVDEAEKGQLVAQRRARRRILGEAEIEAVGAVAVAAHRRDHLLVQPLAHGAAVADRLLLVVPHDGAVIGRRHLDALHRRVAAGIAGQQLVPDVEPGRDVPDALQQR